MPFPVFKQPPQATSPGPFSKTSSPLFAPIATCSFFLSTPSNLAANMAAADKGNGKPSPSHPTTIVRDCLQQTQPRGRPVTLAARYAPLPGCSVGVRWEGCPGQRMRAVLQGPGIRELHCMGTGRASSWGTDTPPERAAPAPFAGVTPPDWPSCDSRAGAPLA